MQTRIFRGAIAIAAAVLQALACNSEGSDTRRAPEQPTPQALAREADGGTVRVPPAPETAPLAGAREAVILKVGAGETSSTLRRMLELLGFQVSELMVGGEGDAPRPGALVILADPGAGALEPALALVDRHLGAGGAALIALEPRAGASLGPLERRLGLRMKTVPLADEQAHVRRRGDATDHGIVATTLAARHATNASVIGGPRVVLLFMESGSLAEIDPPPAGAKRMVTVRSMATSFADVDRNHRRGAREEMRPHPIAAAVELEPAGGRAFVAADASWLGEDVLRNVPAMQLFTRDVVDWLIRAHALTAPRNSPGTGAR